MAPDSEDILEPIFLTNLCMISRNFPTGHLYNIQGHIQEDCNTVALGFDFCMDHPMHSLELTGRAQGQKLVRTLKMTKFENYFSRDCTSFYVFCTM